ncbi:MAG: hypothetical protein IT370_01995 [Deltaproteobacteria bacterium]|nr:hypothetical protein [Deltaproteobacteria bacterium]
MPGSLRLVVVPLLWACAMQARAADAAALELRPPAGELVLGRVTELSCDLTLPGAAVVEGNPEISATVTPLVRLERLPDDAAGAHWRVVLAPPPDTAPQIALVGARVRLAGGAELRAFTAIALTGTARLPVHTEARASVTVEVAGKSFGPVIADLRGDAPVPIEVPPGTTSALARSRARRGAMTEQRLELPAPPYPRLLAIAPSALGAGELGQIDASFIDAAGRATPLAAPLRAPDRLPTPPELAWSVSPPGQPALGASGVVALHPGPTSQLAVRAARSRVHVGELIDLITSATDRFGNPTLPALTTRLEGAVVEAGIGPAPRSAGPGARLVRVRAPTRWPGRPALRIELEAPGAPPARVEVALALAAPSALSIRGAPARVVGRRGPTVRVLARDAGGGPAELGDVVVRGPDQPLTLTACPAPGECVYRGRPRSPRGVTRYAVEARVGELGARTVLTLYPAPRRLELEPQLCAVSNLGELTGAGGGLEARGRLAGPLALGLFAAALRSEITGSDASGSTALSLSQLLLLGTLRVERRLGARLWLALDGLAGVSLASVRQDTPSEPELHIHSSAAALGAGASAEVLLGPGRVTARVRWLRTRLPDTGLEGEALGLALSMGYALGF